jgi:hypothetical protein
LYDFGATSSFSEEVLLAVKEGLDACITTSSRENLGAGGVESTVCDMARARGSGDMAGAGEGKEGCGTGLGAYDVA